MSRRIVTNIILAALLIAVLLCLFLVPDQIMLRHSSASMLPTITPGDLIKIDQKAFFFSSPKRWDVVAFSPDPKASEVWCLRVVGLPNESVEITSAGTIEINGKKISPPKHIDSLKWHLMGMNKKKFTVPKNSFFLLGDNSDLAKDSRFIGSISIDDIIGKVLEDVTTNSHD